MKLALYLYGVSLCLIVFVWQFLSKPDDTVNDCSDSRFAFYQKISTSSSSNWLKSTTYPEICRTPPSTEDKRKQHGYFLHITDMHVR